MHVKEKKFPENVNSRVKESLGFGLEELLGEKKTQVLKNELSAILCTHPPEDNYPEKIPVTLKKGACIIIEDFDYHSIGQSNTTTFQLSGLVFNSTEINSPKSHFFVHIDKLITALK